jgi:hypothetical protein
MHRKASSICYTLTYDGELVDKNPPFITPGTVSGSNIVLMQDFRWSPELTSRLLMQSEAYIWARSCPREVTGQKVFERQTLPVTCFIV